MLTLVLCVCACVRCSQSDTTGETVLWVFVGLTMVLTLLTGMYVCATSRGTTQYLLNQQQAKQTAVNA